MMSPRRSALRVGFYLARYAGHPPATRKLGRRLIGAALNPFNRLNAAVWPQGPDARGTLTSLTLEETDIIRTAERELELARLDREVFGWEGMPLWSRALIILALPLMAAFAAVYFGITAAAAAIVWRHDQSA